MKIEEAYPEAYRLARIFHNLYEQFAPSFGYATRTETKNFDPESNNGRLMAYVCYKIVKEEKQTLIEQIRQQLIDEATFDKDIIEVFDKIISRYDIEINNLKQ